MVYYYRIYGLTVKSDYEFEEAIKLEKEDVERIDVVVEEKELPPEIMGETDEEKNKGEINVYFLERNKGWFRWYGCGSFVMTNGNRIEYQTISGCNRLEINELFLCLAFFYILYQRGMIAMHGSGLVWKGKTIIVSGQSGSGKSSLAEAILKQGAKFLADDTVALTVNENGVWAEPAYPQQKLCIDQITEEMRKSYNMVLLPEDRGVAKYGVRMPDRFCTVAQKLDALIILQKNDEITEPAISEIHGADKMKYLIQNLYKYDTYARVGLEADIFKKCIKVANEIKIYLISRPAEGMTVERQLELVNKVLN
ncbi:MAG: hypothetical protein MR531_16300 [Lachnospiraceae bacterium]|nr:hypothetical protein [Lachnospiraceae bacterium]